MKAIFSIPVGPTISYVFNTKKQHIDSIYFSRLFPDYSAGIRRQISTKVS